MEIVELLKLIGIIYLVIGIAFGLLARYSALALSKVSNVCSTLEHSAWTSYIIEKRYLKSNNSTERTLGLIHDFSGKVLRLILISIPFTALVISAYVVFWLIAKYT